MYSYVARMYSYVFVCYSYVLACYSYVFVWCFSHDPSTRACEKRALLAEPQMKHYTDAELARVSVLTLDVTKTAYVSLWQASGKCHEKF